MSFQTITLKLHKPSREKRRILEDAMDNYTKSFDFLLREARNCLFDPEEYLNGSKYKLSKWVNQDLSARLNQFNTEPFKDSLKLDFAMTFSSYLELKVKGKKPGYPSTYTDSAGDLINLRPVFFCRYDTKRDYCLLYNEKKCKYYIKLYLMNHKTARKNPEASVGKESKLEYVHKNKLKLEKKALKERFIIVPLSFGTWQEKYLKLSLKNPEILKTARLIQRNGEFFITINLMLPAKEKIETNTYMGISRGPEDSVYLTISDRFGNTVDSECISLNESAQSISRKPLAELFRVVNQVVNKALDYKSQVILENLTDHKDGAYEVDFDCGENQNILRKLIYQSLDRILTYKLEYAGLPQPVKVSPFGIFSTCPKCGMNTKRNRSTKGMFLCISCGEANDIKYLGSINLANKLIKYSTDDIKIKVTKEDEGIKLYNEMLGLNIRLSSAESLVTNLEQKILDIIQDSKENPDLTLNHEDFKKRWSMIQKIESFDDFTKHITFISSSDL